MGELKYIKCNRCGKPVSSMIPKETIVRAWIECPECINYSKIKKKEIKNGKK